MSSSVTQSALTPAVSHCQDGVRRYLRDSSEMLWITMESTSLGVLTSATVKNLPYILFSDAFTNSDLSHFISSRVNYLEVAVVSLACYVHHYMMALFYTAAFFVTMGFSDEVNYSFQKHWVNFGFSSLSIVIAVTGVVIPSLAALLNKELVMAIISSVRRSYKEDVSKFEGEIITWIQEIFKENRFLIENFSMGYYKESYQRDVHPSIELIDNRLETAQKIEDLFQLFTDFIRTWPCMNPKNSSEEMSLSI